MSAIIFENSITVPAGGDFTAFTGLTFSPSKPALTALVMIAHTTALGSYNVRTGNSLHGGVPNAGFQAFYPIITPPSTAAPGADFAFFPYKALNFWDSWPTMATPGQFTIGAKTITVLDAIVGGLALARNTYGVDASGSYWNPKNSVALLDSTVNPPAPVLAPGLICWVIT